MADRTRPGTRKQPEEGSQEGEEEGESAPDGPGECVAPRPLPGRHGRCFSSRYFSAACIMARATGAARPLPLTSERAASDCSTMTATATSLPLASDLP